MEIIPQQYAYLIGSLYFLAIWLYFFLEMTEPQKTYAACRNNFHVAWIFPGRNH